MLRTLKILGWSCLLLASLSTARAFSLLGPVSVDTWQVQELGYMLTGRGVDKGAPKNLGEEYRFNTPVLYYAFDQSFLDYFGSNGVRAVSQAFNVFNALTNASAVDLAKVPVAVKKQNYRAQSAQLLDLKSWTMSLLIEQLGLADAVRYNWALQARYTPAGVTCPGPGMVYLVLNRNFAANPSTLDMYQSTNVINDVFYTYWINETCVAPNPLAEAVAIPPDPYQNYNYAPVASMRVFPGDFFTGLTRDDVSGLRYLYSSNNINFEAVDPSVQLLVSNPPVILSTSNLVQLISDSATNAPVVLQGLYPNIQISSYVSQFTNWITTNYTFYYTNYPWTTGGAAPSLISLTNYTTNIGTHYQYQFANVVTNPGPPFYTNSNPPFTNSYVTIIYTNIVAGPYVTPDQVVTNVYVTNVNISEVSGDFYIVPTNACGGLLVASNQLSLLVLTTNATEAVPSPQLLITNAINFLTTSNLAQLISDASTNGYAALLALYPGLQITNYVPSFTNIITTNLTGYYTNYPWGNYGQPPVLVFATNYYTNVGYIYQYQFGNVVTNTHYSNSLVTVLVTNITTEPWGLPGTVFTNIYLSNYWASIPSGDYYILPTNNGCGGVIILSNILSQLNLVTNGTLLVTNTMPGSQYTNLYYSETTLTYFTNQNLAYFLVTCYSNPFVSSLTRITHFTNRNLKTSIVSCETNPPGLMRGVEKISFVRRDFDSLIGQTFEPATNFYKLYGIQGSSNVVQNVRRRVTAPDFLIRANDLPATDPDGSPTFNMTARTVDNFDLTYKLPNLAGPGTFTLPVVFTYNRVGVWFENSSPYLGQQNGSRFYTWGTFAGDNGAPIYYPNGTSIENLEKQVIMQITTTNLPDGQVTNNYPALGVIFQLTGSGGQPPYIWSQSPSSPGMPPGLFVFSDGTIRGMPAKGSEGTYDIIIRMADAGARYVERAFTLLVKP